MKHSRLQFLLRGIGLMTRAELTGLAGIVALMMFGGLCESSILALVVPLVYVIVDPGKFESTHFGKLIETHLGAPITSLFPYFVLTLIILIVCVSALTIFVFHMAEWHAARCRERVIEDLLKRCMDAPYVWIVRHNSALLGRRIVEEVRSWRNDFIYSMVSIVQAVIMVIAPAMVVVAIAPLEGVAALGLVALVCALVIMGLRRTVRANARLMKGAQNNAVTLLHQFLSGIREIKIGGRSDFFVSKFMSHYEESNRAGTKTRTWSMAPASVINGLGQIGFLLTAFVFWYQGISGSEIIAQLALIGVIVSRVVPAFNRIAASSGMFFQSQPYVEALLELRESVEKAIAAHGRPGGGAPVSRDWRIVELDNVSVQYPGAKVRSLENVSIKLERGRFYGFVGRSGAGKSTLVNTLLGLLEPTQGSVKIDGKPLREYRLQDWQGRFGYVPQDPFVLDASMRDNIAFGTTPDDDRIRAVLKDVQLDALMSAVQGNLDMPLRERGRQLSGGQSQRVTIARALYRDSQVFLFDEATSALDSITESEVYRTLDEHRGRVLGLIVAHRITSLRRCDRIFIMEAGRVLDAGSYDELMQNSATFQALAAERTSAEAAQ
jgi:HlyD family secretion protein